MEYKNLSSDTEKILNNSIETSSTWGKVSYKNVYKGLVTAISVDIRDYKKLCEDCKPEVLTKIIQAFSQSIILIGKKYSSNFVFSSLNGDEVILVYATPRPIGDCADKIFEISKRIRSYLEYVFKIKIKDKYKKEINYGIGIALADNDIICKYGHKGTSEDSEYTVIGSSINDASKLSNNKNINHIRCNDFFFNSLQTKKAKNGVDYFNKLSESTFEGDIFESDWFYDSSLFD